MSQKINNHNQKYADGLVDFSLAINRMADLSAAQIEQFTTGNRNLDADFDLKMRPRAVINVNSTMFPPGPPSIDWKAKGHVTPVKDQGFTW